MLTQTPLVTVYISCSNDDTIIRGNDDDIVDLSTPRPDADSDDGVVDGISITPRTASSLPHTLVVPTLLTK